MASTAPAPYHVISSRSQLSPSPLSSHAASSSSLRFHHPPTPPPSHNHQQQQDPQMGSSLIAQDDQSSAELPLIDLELLCHADEAEIQKLVIAAKELGFVQVANHGVPCKLLSEIEEQACHAYALPAEAKARAEVTPGSTHGYLPKSSGGDGKPPRLSEAFRLPLNKQHRADMITKFWPEGNEAFSSVVDEYIAAVEPILLQILRSLASGLGLDPLQFMQDLSKDGNSAVLRMNFYTASQPLPTLGFPAHSDPQIITIVYQNGVDGLQILKDDKWIAVKPRLGSFVVNVGDMLQVMSNDLCPSVVHRVVMNTDKFRSSIVFTLTTHPQATVRPAPQLVTERRPSRYRPFTAEEYFLSMNFQEFNAGKSHLDNFRIITPEST